MSRTQDPAVASDDPTLQAPWQLYSPRQRVVLLAVLFIISTSNYIDRNLMGIVLEPIKTEFGASDTLMGLLTGLAFAIFYATLGLPFARWSDRGDRRVITVLAVSIWSLMTVLCGFAQTFWQLVLARIGVGAGEAGGLPAAQSLVADYFPPDARARAISFLMMSGVVGGLVGAMAGGFIAETHGWRALFLIAGAPGLLLALISWALLKEPRKIPRFAVRRADAEGVAAAFKALASKPSFVNIVLSLTTYFMISSGASVFTASFLLRVHHVTLSEAGVAIGLMAAGGAIVGNLAGGYATDRLAKTDKRWLAWIPGYGLIAAFPIHLAAFAAPSFPIMICILFLAAVVLVAMVPPLLTAIHAVCGSKRRATAIAVAFFFCNLIGLSLGPLMTGALSDAFSQTLGSAEGLRYALIAVNLVFVPSGIFMLRAARHIENDLEA